MSLEKSLINVSCTLHRMVNQRKIVALIGKKQFICSSTDYNRDSDMLKVLNIKYIFCIDMNLIINFFVKVDHSLCLLILLSCVDGSIILPGTCVMSS